MLVLFKANEAQLIAKPKIVPSYFYADVALGEGLSFLIGRCIICLYQVFEQVGEAVLNAVAQGEFLIPWKFVQLRNGRFEQVINFLNDCVFLFHENLQKII